MIIVKDIKEPCPNCNNPIKQAIYNGSEIMPSGHRGGICMTCGEGVREIPDKDGE